MNIDIHGTKDVIGEHMSDYCTQNDIPCKAITYTPKQCFKGIVDDIANARREGDVDEDMALQRL